MNTNSASKFFPRRRRFRGVSLLEVTVGSLMASGIAIAAASVACDVSRHMAAGVAETRVALEARLALEAFRRDFGGSLPEARVGEKNHWRLVGRMIPSSDELRLCFDSQQDASADWIAPDRVITYSLQGDELTRSDATTGNTYTVARHVEDVQFAVNGNDLEVSIDFRFRDFTETYSFVTADVP